MPLQYRAKLAENAPKVTDPESGLKLNPGVQANRKESSFYKEYAALVPSGYNRTMRAVVCVRLYATASRVYCCVWIFPKDGGPTHAGGGHAGGYGYHKASAAMESALDAAGVKLESRVEPAARRDGIKARAKYERGGLAGRGDSAMLEALHALAKAAGYPRARSYVAHA